MISTIDSQAWAAADLTGNSALVVIGSDIYVVGGSRGDHTQAIYRSTDNGRTWAVLTALPASPGALDPAVVADELGVLHIVTSRETPGDSNLTDVLKFTYNPGTGVLSSPAVLVTGSKVQAAYDIVSLGAGAALVVTAVDEPIAPGGFTARYALLAFEVAADLTFTTTPLIDQPWDRGDTFGGISMVAPGGSAPVELYYTSHPRVLAFKDTETKILRRIRTSASVWGDPTALSTFTSRFTDDKLTVVPTLAGGRLISTAFHQQFRGVLWTSAYYGVGTFDAGTSTWSWAFSTLAATTAWDYKEPVMGTDGASLFLMCLQAARPSRTGGFRVFTVDPGSLALTPHPAPPNKGAWEVLQFKWLRGIKAQVAEASRWMVVGIQGSATDDCSGGGSVFLSELNLPPVPSLLPSSATVQRGEVLVLDASATQDPDLDTLEFTWAHTSPDLSYVHLTPIDNGRRAMLLVDRGIGPAEKSFTVSVSVKDPLHDPVVLGATITVPYNAAPVLTLQPTWVMKRNSEMTLSATVADADACTFLWEQIDGSPVEILHPNTLTPIIRAYRMNTQGEEVTLRLTVSDGVNPPATAETGVVVSAMLAQDLDVGKMARAYYTQVQYN